MISLDDAQQLEREKCMSAYKSVNNNHEDAQQEIMLAVTFSQTGLPSRMDAAVGIHREWSSMRFDYAIICVLPRTWTGLPRQAADEHFPRKERRFHQARRPAAGRRRKRKRTRGDCRQRVTSGTILQPPAQSPVLGGRCHHTSTIEHHPFSFHFPFFKPRTRFVATRPKTGSSDRERNASCATSPRSRHLRFTSLPSSHTPSHMHTIESIDRPTDTSFLRPPWEIPSVSNLRRRAGENHAIILSLSKSTIDTD